MSGQHHGSGYETSWVPNPLTRWRRGWLVAAVTFSALGLVGSAVALTAVAGSAGSRAYVGTRALASYGGMTGGLGTAGGRTGTQNGCSVPPLKGSVVTFSARDMGMSGGMMGGTSGSPLGPARFMPGSAVAPAGEVSIVLSNAGTRPHELVVLPLASGQVAGQRAIGANDLISEAGALGEVHPVCPPDTDVDGTVPGGLATLTLRLAPGSYEVVCNLPGHYRSGMYALLTVT